MNLGLGTSVIARVLASEPEHLAVAAPQFISERTRAGDPLLVSYLVPAGAPLYPAGWSSDRFCGDTSAWSATVPPG